MNLITSFFGWWNGSCLHIGDLAIANDIQSAKIRYPFYHTTGNICYFEGSDVFETKLMECQCMCNYIVGNSLSNVV